MHNSSYAKSSKGAAKRLALALMALLAIVLAPAAKAEDAFALNGANGLLRFDTATPGTVISTTAVTGLGAGETLVGIDFRPATGQLYGLTLNAGAIKLYVISAGSGAAVQVGGPNAITLPTLPTPVTLTGTRYGFDFNPSVDRIRVTSDSGQNFRINPNDAVIADGDNGGVTPAPAGVQLDGTLAYFDANSSATPKVAGSAYLNNFSGATGTTLFDIDSGIDVLAQQNPPNSGGLLTVGKLGVDFGDQVGFDISAYTGTGFATSQPGNTGDFKLYEVSLATGSALEIGSFPAGTTVTDIALPTGPTTIVYGLTVSGSPANRTNSLVKFSAAAPTIQIGATATLTIDAAETVVGMDFRPANGLLYAITSNGTAFNLYSIDPTAVSATNTIATTKIGTGFNVDRAFDVTGFTSPSPNPAGDGNVDTDPNFYGMDFNPVPDRIRFVTNQGGNVRINPDTGAIAAVDGPLAFATGDTNAGDSPFVVAVAYVNNFAGATATTLYDIDFNNDILTTQNPPNSGTLNTIGTTGLGPVLASGDAGFDITPDGRGFANFQVGASMNFYAVGLATGKVANLGTLFTLPGPVVIRDIAIPTSPSAQTGTGTGGAGVVSFSAAAYSVVEGNSIDITVTRTGGTSGTISVDFVTTSGTATIDSDFTAEKQTLTFVDGQSSRIVTIKALSDIPQELFETVGLALINPVGGTVGAQGTAILTIADVNDLDGDGFSNAEETAAGSDPNSASSTPFGSAAAGPAGTLTVTKTAFKLTFTKAGGDAISFTATIPAVADLATLDAKKVVVNYGGVTKSVTFAGGKGKAVSGDKKDSVTVKKPKNNVSQVDVKLNKGDFDALPSAGTSGTLSLTDATGATRPLNDADSPSKARRNVVIKLFINNLNLQKTQPLDVKISGGKGASGKNPKGL